MQVINGPSIEVQMVNLEIETFHGSELAKIFRCCANLAHELRKRE